MVVVVLVVLVGDLLAASAAAKWSRSFCRQNASAASRAASRSALGASATSGTGAAARARAGALGAFRCKVPAC